MIENNITGGRLPSIWGRISWLGKRWKTTTRALFLFATSLIFMTWFDSSLAAVFDSWCWADSKVGWPHSLSVVWLIWLVRWKKKNVFALRVIIPISAFRPQETNWVSYLDFFFESAFFILLFKKFSLPLPVLNSKVRSIKGSQSSRCVPRVFFVFFLSRKRWPLTPKWLQVLRQEKVSGVTTEAHSHLTPLHLGREALSRLRASGSQTAPHTRKQTRATISKQVSCLSGV